MKEFIISYCINVLGYTPNQAEEEADKLIKHPDILKEFINWLATGKYESNNPLTIEGYTAQRLHEEFDFLKPIGVYNYLISLREKPEEALKWIKKGLPRK